MDIDYTDVLDRYAGRVPSESMWALREAESAGEYGLLIETLVTILAEDGIVISTEERSELRRIVDANGGCADDYLDRLITTASATNESPDSSTSTDPGQREG